MLQGKFSRRKNISLRNRINTGDSESTRELAGNRGILSLSQSRGSLQLAGNFVVGIPVTTTYESNPPEHKVEQGVEQRILVLTVGMGLLNRCIVTERPVALLQAELR
jgi:hypothetical protein